MKHGSMSLVVSLALMVGLLTFSSVAFAQDPVATSQDFDSIGTPQTATLPTYWKVDKNTTVRTLGSYSAAGTVTEQRAGNNMSSTATNGIYNYGAGAADTATDRAVGWISSGSATKSGNLYGWFQNNTSSNVASVDISYDVEKYRNGSNAAGFSIQMYYSTDGSTWTSAGSNFLTSFAADADNSGFASAPGTTVSVVAKTLTFATPIPVSGTFYLAWNYSVTSGTTTSNAQGLGIDNFSMGNPLAVTLADFHARQVNDHVQVSWETVSEVGNAGFNLYRSEDPAALGQQLNAALIPSQSPGSTGGFSYTWEDRADLVPGSIYFYTLEDVDLSGATTRHGPVSVAFVTPTAVRLSSASATPAAAGSALLPWLLAAGGAGALLALGRKRR